MFQSVSQKTTYYDQHDAPKKVRVLEEEKFIIRSAAAPLTFVVTAGTLSFIANSPVTDHPEESGLVKHPHLGQTGGCCLSHRAQKRYKDT